MALISIYYTDHMLLYTCTILLYVLNLEKSTTLRKRVNDIDLLTAHSLDENQLIFDNHINVTTKTELH